MVLSRRDLLGSSVLLGLVAACGAPAPAAPQAAAPADVATLLDWIAAHRDQVSLVVDGAGATLLHDPDRQRPVASAAKVIHLLAYSQAVASGRLDPQATVTRQEWESWWVPGTDGFGHDRAIEALGGVPGGTVRWDDLAAVMIDVSDSAAPDLLRHTLGDPALVAAAEAAGWANPDLPSYGGQSLLAPAPFGVGGLPADTPAGPERRARELAALTSYAADPAQQAQAGERRATAALLPPRSEQEADVYRWYAGSATGSAAQLAAIHGAIATGAVDGPLGAGTAAVAQRHLGRSLADQVAPPIAAYGQKGGNLPGSVTNAFSVRRDDGGVGVSVLIVSDVAVTDYEAMSASGSPLLLSQQALIDAGVRDRLRTALGAV